MAGVIQKTATKFPSEIAGVAEVAVVAVFSGVMPPRESVLLNPY